MKNTNIILISLIAVFVCVQVPMAQENVELKKISLTYSDFSPPTTAGIIFMKE